MAKHTAVLRRSTKKDKKYMVTIDGTKTIHFGARGMSDYTKHKDSARKGRYSSRHKRNENWSSSGIKTAGFWSKNLLWNKPSLAESIKSTSRRYGISIRRGGSSSRSKSRRSRRSRRRSAKRSSRR